MALSASRGESQVVTLLSWMTLMWSLNPINETERLFLLMEYSSCGSINGESQNHGGINENPYFYHHLTRNLNSQYDINTHTSMFRGGSSAPHSLKSGNYFN